MTPAAFQFTSLLFTGAAIGVGAITLRKLYVMSGNLDDIAAREEASLAKISADLTAIALELKDQPPAGTVVTQAQLDRHSAIADRLESVATQMDALIPAAEPPTEPPATPTA